MNLQYGAKEVLRNREGNGRSEDKTVIHKILQLENQEILVETLVGNSLKTTKILHHPNDH